MSFLQFSFHSQVRSHSLSSLSSLFSHLPSHLSFSRWFVYQMITKVDLVIMRKPFDELGPFLHVSETF